ncbi:hypothetical protein ABMA32_10420 [Mesorhizobium sp. VNQ89]
MLRTSSRRSYLKPTVKKSLVLLQSVTAQTTSPIDPGTGGGGT